jgi:hypothetical protein
MSSLFPYQVGYFLVERCIVAFVEVATRFDRPFVVFNQMDDKVRGIPSPLMARQSLCEGGPELGVQSLPTSNCRTKSASQCMERERGRTIRQIEEHDWAAVMSA